KPLYGDAPLVSMLAPTGCDSLDVCGAAKLVCVQGDLNVSLAQLTTQAAASYPLFFCGEPTHEPTCTPARPQSVTGSAVYSGAPSPSDTDGDGLDNAHDNCPRIFNPVRPVDHGMQADADADGAGDSCDPCPLDANTTTCKTFDPNDSDSDGIPN